MSESVATRIRPLAIVCANCKRVGTAMGIDDRREYVAMATVETGSVWFVTDTYPPGDMGLAFLCSGTCLEEWERKEEASR